MRVRGVRGIELCFLGGPGVRVGGVRGIEWCIYVMKEGHVVDGCPCYLLVALLAKQKKMKK